jgi:adenosine deaminase
MMDRTLTREQNEIIVEKAIKYAGKGIIGIDLAGPDRRGFSIASHAPLFWRAKEAGLGVTLHSGETGDPDELRYVVNKIVPHRIGHGIIAARDPKLMEEIVAAKITLELCPTSNLKNSMVRNAGELKAIIRKLVDHGVSITVNTDGPELYHTNVYKEQRFLIDIGALSEKEMTRCNKRAFQASFLQS